MHEYTYITHARTHIRTIHTYIYTYVRTYIRTCSHTCIRTSGHLKIWLITQLQLYSNETHRENKQLLHPKRPWPHDALPSSGCKSQKTPDTSKRLHRNETRSTGSAGKKELDPNYCHHWDCGLGKAQVRQAWGHLAGVWNVLPRWRLQPGFTLWFPPDPRRRCSKLLNLNGWTAFCIPWYNFLIMAPRARQWGANCPLCPTLLLDLRPEAGYTFAPFGSIWSCKYPLNHNELVLAWSKW